MGFLDFLDDGWIDDDSINHEAYRDTNFDKGIEITKDDFVSGLDESPNIHLDTLEDAIAEGDLESVTPQVEGVAGNVLAKKYFIGEDASVDSEIAVPGGRVDLLVAPNHPIDLTKITLQGNQIELENFETTQPFSVEVKSYATESYNFLSNSGHLAEQLQNGSHLSDHSYLGVTRDFLNLDFNSQQEIIKMAELNGDGVIVLPYYKFDIESNLNDILGQIS